MPSMAALTGVASGCGAEEGFCAGRSVVRGTWSGLGQCRSRRADRKEPEEGDGPDAWGREEREVADWWAGLEGRDRSWWEGDAPDAWACKEREVADGWGLTGRDIEKLVGSFIIRVTVYTCWDRSLCILFDSCLCSDGYLFASVQMDTV